jgi:putative acetyltransferase
VPLVVDKDDPRADDVGALLKRHLAFSRGVTPAEYAFALDVEELADPSVTFFSARRDGVLMGVAALKHLDRSTAELKSMHTREDERGRGVGRAILEHILDFARSQGYLEANLETGTTEEFAAARALYASSGFRPCAPFGQYEASPYNTFMTLRLDEA